MKRRRGKNSRWVKGAAFLTLGVLGVMPQSAGSPPAGPAEKPRIKNVLVIVLDALRADHLGIYGYPRNTSPNIDRLARNGIVFDRAIVQADWTKPSIPTYFTSTYPGVHGTIESEDIFPSKLLTMAEVFLRNGYFTYGFHNNIVIDSKFGFDRGFRVYRNMTDDRIFDTVWLTLTKGYVNAGLFDAEKLKTFADFIRQAGEANLVGNPGFEENGAHWVCQTNWLDNEVIYSGKRSAHIEASTAPDSNFRHLSRRLKVEHGRDYIFGAFVRTKDLQGNVKVEIKEPAAKKYTVTNALRGTHEWSLLLGVFRPQTADPKLETEIELIAGRVHDFQGGEFWLDDVFLLPLDEAPFFKPNEKAFFYLHFLDPHSPYIPPVRYLDCFQREDKQEQLIDRYDAEIRAIDERLGLFLGGLETRGILDDTLVIITADHGEAFGEHDNRYGHGGNNFHEEVIRVPLIIYNPELFPIPKRLGNTMEAGVSLLPSLINLLRLQIPPGAEFQGRSVFLEKNRSPHRAFSYAGTSPVMVTDGKWKYIKTPSTLFDLTNDPDEEVNVAERYPDKVGEFQRLIRERALADREFLKGRAVGPGGKAEITEPMKEQFRALGYLD